MIQGQKQHINMPVYYAKEYFYFFKVIRSNQFLNQLITSCTHHHLITESQMKNIKFRRTGSQTVYFCIKPSINIYQEIYSTYSIEEHLHQANRLKIGCWIGARIRKNADFYFTLMIFVKDYYSIIIIIQSILKFIQVSMTDYPSERRQLEAFNDIDHIPTQYSKRNCTDVFCIAVGLGFSLVMFILAIALFNYPNYFQVNFPADSDGVLCGIDQPAYPYVYFANPPEIARRVCVSDCPKSGDNGLNCVPTESTGCQFTNSQGYEVVFYENQAVNTRNGRYCYPKDEALLDKVLVNSKLKNRISFMNSLDTIVLCFFVAFGVSILYFLLVQFFPKPMNYAAVIVGGLAILATAICLFFYDTQQTTIKVIAGIILLLFLLLVIMTVFKNRDSWQMHAVFLTHATRLIKQRPLTALYIPIFFIILMAFATILVLEFWSYWSSGTVTFDGEKSLFHELEGFFPLLLSVFLIIQTIWGLSFIKEAFNFCIAGQAVNWYYEKDHGFMYPFKLLLCKHLGSVIAGSFMTGFFSLTDLLFDIVKPDENANPNGCYTKCYKSMCMCCIKIFDLVRSDAMAFINLTGNPFCNSSRYCQYLCGRSIIMDYSQSTSRAYRLCAHFLIVGIIAIFALYVKGVISIYALLVIMVETLFIATLFISAHADAAEAIQIVFLADEQFSRRKKEDNNLYQHTDIEGNLTGFRYRPQVAEDVKNMRVEQKNKRDKK